MKKSNGKYVLIFLLLAAWVALVFIIVRSEKTEGVSLETPSLNYSTFPYSDEELKALAQTNENFNEPEVTPEDPFEINNQEVIVLENPVIVNSDIDSQQEDISLANEPIQYDNPYQDVVDMIMEAENNPPETIIVVEDAVVDSLPETESIIVGEDIAEGEQEPMYEIYSGLDFLESYNNFEQNQNLDFLSKYIYNINTVDEYIKEKAETRGYVQRGFAKNDDLIYFENVQTRPEVKKAYVMMRDEMMKENIRLHFVSGYRSSTSQRSIFTRKMEILDPNEIPTGIHDQKLDDVLSRSAIPAYSKHHSGYALDFGCGNDYLVFSFAETPCYDWLSADNFANARKYGFIPSYPDGVDSQGPNPEPWEFVWVGPENTL